MKSQRKTGSEIRSSIKSGRGALASTRLVVCAVAVLAVAVFAALDTASMRYAIIMGLIYAIAILGNNAVTATLGEINLGMSATMAFGAYAVAYCLNQGVALPVALLVAVAATTLIGALLAVPTVRLTGMIFTALVTFALAFAVPHLAVYLKRLTGGAEGAGLPVDPQLFGVVVGGSATGMLVLTAVIFIVLSCFSSWMFNGRLGRIALLAGEAPAAAMVFGIHVRSVQIAVWTWASLVGGIAGALFALAIGYVSPTQFDPMVGIALVTGGIIGGVRSAPGALLGGLLVGTLPSQLQSIMPAAGTGILFGLILFAAILVGGQGLAQGVERALLALSKRFSGTHQ